jgi:hypothetical protein
MQVEQAHKTARALRHLHTYIESCGACDHHPSSALSLQRLCERAALPLALPLALGVAMIAA